MDVLRNSTSVGCSDSEKRIEIKDGVRSVGTVFGYRSVDESDAARTKGLALPEALEAPLLKGRSLEPRRVSIPQGCEQIEGTQIVEMCDGSRLTFVKPSELAEKGVYSFFDEGGKLLKAYLDLQRSRPFFSEYPLMVDCFSGAGHSYIPIAKHSKIKQGVLLDIDEAALTFARKNIQLNQLSSDSVKTVVFDMMDEKCRITTDVNTLFVANPPFALNIEGAPVDRIRDGGRDGLELTRKAVTRFFEVAKAGDDFIGLAYSLVKLDDNGCIIKSDLKDFIEAEKIQVSDCDVTISINLLSDEKLWRGVNGLKEQPNPMPLTAMHFNAKAKFGETDKMEAYRKAEERYKKEGTYSHLGYFTYTIEVGKKSS